METIKELTVEQFKGVMKECIAETKTHSNLTDDEIKELAQKLNEKINIPLISEVGEEKILTKIVTKIDNYLSENLPDEFYDLLRDSDKGISDEEAKQLIIRLTKTANKQIDIPYLPESVEGLAIKIVIKIIVESARKKCLLLNEK
ncbi:MAG: hypothetical protein GQ564_17540 [Bacteroidales bacterium]|nr:hypothetical protein [Bacteroidales bacterium]